MRVLRELLTKEGTDSDIKTTYQYVFDLKERLQETLNLAQEMLAKSADRYKKYYDRGAKPRSLKEGDKVLVLLPTDNNKLLLHWKGPYPVVQRLNDCDYKVRIKDKVKTFHINLLKRYVTRQPTDAEAAGCVFDSPILDENGFGCEVEVSHDEENCVDDGMTFIPMPRVVRKQGPRDIKVSDHLSPSQKTQLLDLVNRYESIFTDVPKQTNVIECKLQLTSDNPIRSKPYPVHYAMREVMNKEIQDMLSLGIIERSTSSYASPVVMV